jgi:hypothetical protein
MTDSALSTPIKILRIVDAQRIQLEDYSYWELQPGFTSAFDWTPGETVTITKSTDFMFEFSLTNADRDQSLNARPSSDLPPAEAHVSIQV